MLDINCANTTIHCGVMCSQKTTPTLVGNAELSKLDKTAVHGSQWEFSTGKKFY